MDTQWPRYQVFVQEHEGDPFVDCGSVHAPDAEMALLNARDVFARRPESRAMWVVPAAAIFSKTHEELANGWQAGAAVTPGAPIPYHVFCKLRHTGAPMQLGVVQAASPSRALHSALEDFSKRFPAAPLWWVFPAYSVTASRPEDADSFYAPANSKGFRLSTDFRTHTLMRELKQGEP